VRNRRVCKEQRPQRNDNQPFHLYLSCSVRIKVAYLLSVPSSAALVAAMR
jgi:hypothetical protein